MPQIDTTRDCEALRKAMKGFGTDEKALINTLVRIPDAYAMASVRSTYQRLHRRDLIADIESETSSYFCEALVALVRGPLGQDVYLANQSTKGIGTNENLLNDVLLGRSNADLRAIIAEYQRVYRKSLEQDVKDDLSMKTERLFSMVLSCSRADESAPVYPQELERDVHDLYHATEGHGGVIGAGSADQLTVCRILTSRSDGQLRAISQEYNRQYRNPLAKVLSKNFDGHMHDALLRILRVAEDRAMADAQELEYCMRGVGTRDRLLLNRVVRIHWDKQHLQQVKGAYRVHMKKELLERVRGETSGDYKRLLEALLL
jgi:annexin A7/11